MTSPRESWGAGSDGAVQLASVALAGIVASLMVFATLVAPEAATQGAAQGQVTFTKDVAPILQRSCQVCHRPGSIAPMSLTSYEEARPWARSIRQRVSRREMPPWGIDRNVGFNKFRDDPSLTDAEISTIVRWVDGGALRGDPADMPPARAFADPNKWQIENPDLVISMPRDYTIKARGSDETLNFVTDPGLTEDRYIQAIETKPNVESLGAVHHSNTNVIEDEVNEPQGTFLNEYSLGKNADVFPEGSARLLKAGSKILFNVHYFSMGEEVKSRSSVAFKFYPKGYVPKYPLVTMHVGDVTELDIPGKTVSRHDGYLRLSKPVQMAALQPHMHTRGKRMCVEAIYPDPVGDPVRPGPTRTEMLNCIDYNFAWNLSYTYDEASAPLLPAGTVLHVIAWHDNTPANRFVPDPRNWVGFGARSVDVMSFCWVNFIYLDEPEFQRRVDARKGRSTVAAR